ncbi:hypothetical protein Csa_004076, partial [Cucumis sativus]
GFILDSPFKQGDGLYGLGVSPEGTAFKAEGNASGWLTEQRQPPALCGEWKSDR